MAANNGRSELDRLIKELKDRIGIQWKTLARELQFNTTDIDSIVVRDRDDLKEQIQRFFEQWKMHKGPEASHHTLIEALREAKLDKILSQLRRVLPDIDFGEEVIAPIEETARDAVPTSPQDIEREHMRSKRLQKLSNSYPNDSSSKSPVISSSPSTVNRSQSSPSGSPTVTKPSASAASPKRDFEIGQVVKVERQPKPWYGVIKYVGTLRDKPVAGLEMEEVVEGGHSGKFLGKRYFTCDDGYGLILPLQQLQLDDRFDPPPLLGQSATSTDDVERDKRMPAPHTPPSALPRKKSDPSPADLSKPPPTLPTSPSGASKSPSEKPETLFVSTDESSDTGILAFECPGDRTGFIIGRDGKNRMDVESKTDTKIQVIKNERDLAANAQVMILGKKENCMMAMLLITQNIRRKMALHTSTTETIEIPSQHCGRVIGKGGSNVQTIEALTGTKINVINDKPKGFLELLTYTPTGQAKCEIKGPSSEQIERAKEMIMLSVDGVNIANVTRFISQFMKELEAEGFKF